MNRFLEWCAKFFGHIDVSGIEAMGFKGLHALLVLLVTFLISRMVQRYINRRMKIDVPGDDMAVQTYRKVARFVIWTLGILIALHVAGINMSSLFTSGGLVAIALAFAMKNSAENYIAGMMLRTEDTIKPGDVLETEGILLKVRKIGFRDTIARSKDEKDILIPNSHLIEQRVTNYTYRDSICRVETTVGVAYSSDLRMVRAVLEKVGANLEGISDEHEPEARLTDFGDSAVNFSVRIWIEDPWKSGLVKSKLNEAVWWGLKEAGIEIAFPQLDVHFDEDFRQGGGLQRVQETLTENNKRKGVSE